VRPCTAAAASVQYTRVLRRPRSATYCTASVRGGRAAKRDSDMETSNRASKAPRLQSRRGRRCNARSRCRAAPVRGVVRPVQPLLHGLERRVDRHQPPLGIVQLRYVLVQVRQLGLLHKLLQLCRRATQFRAWRSTRRVSRPSRGPLDPAAHAGTCGAYHWRGARSHGRAQSATRARSAHSGRAPAPPAPAGPPSPAPCDRRAQRSRNSLIRHRSTKDARPDPPRPAVPSQTFPWPPPCWRRSSRRPPW